MKRAPLAILGTSSHAGKTTVVAGLCRLYARRGLRVAPLKSQNMSLNSYATRHGEEIARSTAVQARAAQQEPTVAMNPILLKPKADDVSQLILFGKPYADVSAAEYFGSDKLQALKWQAIDAAIASLRRDYDLIVVEGAGSCAEPNLRALDVVNFGLARRLAAEVHILCDIDKGGVFADILGTLQVLSLTEPADAALVRGFLINKFRGDPRILDGGLDFIRPHLGSASLGVLPYLDLSLEEEDRIRPRRCLHPEIDIAVLYLPHIANATDFEHLSVEENVSLRFVRRADELLSPDAIIVPGSKNTIWDLEYLRRCGLADELLWHAGKTPLVGICGGFEMLGGTLFDPDRTESSAGSVPGLGLLAVDFAFQRDKLVRPCRYRPSVHNPLSDAGEIEGYEIHTGRPIYRGALPLFESDAGPDGAIDAERLIFGSFVHDLWKNPRFTRSFVDWLRVRKGLTRLSSPLPDHRDRFEQNIESLADAIEALGIFR
ncbi:MAG: cobyric acid synthase [Deltaproteobacteria bacterium]|nr:cobyric acid synthase [Deltaproteobacteria bacterium]